MTVGHLVTLAGVLFTIGMMGVLSRRNILIVLLSVELMLNATALAFCAFANMADNLDGQVMVFFILTVAAAEVGVGLAMVIALFRLRVTVNTDRVDLLRG
ncbi:MAG: NADH-quinone oxidoreductase subunit NuoK [Planctomycetota bacterium]|nr:NADH-quinone oxidoreductase subunit NuoK [Planctomycetota bacterium]